MPEKFKNRYRVPSNRLRGWNYARNGHYFITIVTYGREHRFGEIVDGQMVLNEIGKIVYDEFFKSFEIREELFLGEFVLMPNHLHAIVILDKNGCEPDENRIMVETHGRASLPHREPQSISSFVAGFKSAAINKIDDWMDENNRSMKKFNKTNPLWQANYHDHIIRNKQEYIRISEYIVHNPENWEEDTLKSDNQ